MTFTEYLKELRARQRKSLRQFCADNGYDPSNWSKVERGASPPPRSKETLGRWAKDLGVEAGTEDWDLFMYRAYVARGEIPASILENDLFERKLPYLFLSMANAHISEEGLDEVARQIENNKTTEWRQW
jgi:transcriptional regulator with XRE-family HTH domain